MSDVKKDVRGFLEQYIDCAEVDDEVDLFATHFINSLFAMQLVLFVEQTYELKLETSDISRANFCSIGAIARLVEGKLG